jgi:hypothetical protein
MEESKNSLKNDLQDSTNSTNQPNEFKYDELNARITAPLTEDYKPDNSFKLKRFVAVILAFVGVWGIGKLVTDVAIPFFSGSEDFAIESTIIEDGNTTENVFPVVLPPVDIKIEGSYLDYLNGLKEANLMDSYEGFERQALYDAGIEVAYLLSLQQSGFLGADAMAFHEIIAFKSAGITIDDLVSFRDRGLMSLLEFHELIAFSNAGITNARLTELKDLGFLDKFDFHEVIGFESNGISTDYILALEKAELLKDIEFFEIIHYWQNDVTVENLVSLKEKGLLADLTFYEISKMFKVASN